MLRPFASAFVAGVVGSSVVRYTSALAQSADARDARRRTYAVRLTPASATQVTCGSQTFMRGQMVVEQ